MKKTVKKKRGDAAEIEDLRARLEEAEEALRAIRSGEVDALIVAGPQGEEVFTLKGAEQPYRVFIEAMNEGAVTLDPQGNILYCNHRFAEMLKTFPEKVIGSSIHPFIPSADASNFESAFETGKREETNVDISLKRKEDGFLPVHLSFNALHGQDMPVVCMVAMDLTERKRYEEEILKSHAELEMKVEERTAELTKINERLRTEIAERKKAEESLRESEQRWATTLASIGDAVIATCEEGKIRFMNAVAEGLTGWTFSEASQKPVKQVFKIINEHTRLEVEDPVAKVIETGTICGLANHTLLVRKDGTEVAIDDSGAPIRDETGKTIGVVLVFRDVSERRRTEEALKRSEEKYRELIRLAPSGIFEVDFRISRFISVNDVMCHYLGYSREELLCMNPFDIMDEKNASLFRERIRKQLNGEEIADSVEYRVRAKNGREYDAILNITFTYEDGKPKGATVIAHDVTDRKQAEEALRKAYEELEKRVQERTSELSEALERLRLDNAQRKWLEDTLRESEKQVRFFASQCLTAQETERKRVAGELHDSVAASLGAVRFTIDKVAEETKQGHSSPESFEDLGAKVAEINNEVRRIMADLRPSLLDDLGIIAAMNWFCREYQKTYSHISVENEIGISEQDVPDSLKTPIFRISQETMNNIAKHSKATLVNLRLQKANGAIELTIQDNGQGFDLNTVRKGMGLSTMRERAQLSGGSFDLASVIGKGTAIRVSWPL